MNKRLVMLCAAVLLALPLGGSVALAQGGGNSNGVSDDTGAACPENSPQGVEEDPSCGEEDRSANKGNKGGNGGDHGNACPPSSPDTDGDGEPDCGDHDGEEAPTTETDCADTVDNDEDGLTDADDPDCQEAPVTETDCADTVDNDEDGLTDADDPDCQVGAQNLCTGAAGDPGLLTEDTLGQTAFDAGLNVSPLFEDPEANGPLSGALRDGGTGTPAEVLTDELGCVVDLLIDESTGFDL